MWMYGHIQLSDTGQGKHETQVVTGGREPKVHVIQHRLWNTRLQSVRL